jgi:predicted nucleic-acid-binding protein
LIVLPVGVDTNLLVRGPLGDDPVQAGLAQSLMESASRGPGLVVSAFAVLEMAWVLRSRKVPRANVVRAVRALLEAEGVVVTHSGLLREAIRRFETGTADLGECLMNVDGQAAGAGSFCTFDQVPQREGWGQDPASLLARLQGDQE